MATNKVKTYNKGFEFNQNKLNYTFQVSKRNWLWLLLLLLLLPLLLFVRCNRQITVTTLDKFTGEEIPGVEVKMNYTSHYLFKNGRFFASIPEERIDTTDVDGKATFSKLGCSVYSYIFYGLSKATFTATDECHSADPDPSKCLFHYTWKKKINMVEKTTSITMEVVDKENHDPLANARVVYQYTLNGNETVDSVFTNGAGQFELANVPQCGDINFRTVSCYGYEDENNLVRNVAAIKSVPDSAIIELTPVKQSFSYFVKNKFTKEPIPEATVTVTLTSPGGNKIVGQATTNVDGKGRGVYNDAFILAKVALHGSKTGYKDGDFEGDYTVEEFAKLPDSLRVVYLEPEPNLEQFQNVDSITGAPIAGVVNAIHRSSIDGNEYDTQEISNRNGVFYVRALVGDHLNIESTHQYYETKITDIEKFSKGQIIPMMPKKTSLNFRTVDAADWSLLDNCTLMITTSLGRTLMPKNSGNGEFTVEDLYYTENLSITASKQDYGTNSTKVNNDPVTELMNAPQERRDIPLEVSLPPCENKGESVTGVNAGNVSRPASYNMGTDSGTFVLDFDNGGAYPDEIKVYNHKPGEPYNSRQPIYTTGMTTGTGSVAITFSQGSVITIVVMTGSDDNSDWQYYIHCPK